MMKVFKYLAGILAIIIVIVAVNSKYILKQYVFPYKHEAIIEEYSKEYDIDPKFVLSIIKAESKFNTSAKSHKDAYGLMQITDETGKWIAKQMNITDYSKEKLYDEEYNIKMGCWYINDLQKEFNNIDLVIVAYNAGRGNVNEWLSNKEYSSDGKSLQYIPYKETSEYLNRVNTYYKIYCKLYN
ncbi:lytic transglycosylase domain-containing protein [Clostridium sp. HCP1S3_B4]|uniref:lytic transglycosylase domain-containing protein n=1 Tax=unclassified Clostridium TaxID=2614128 RepID=UPI002A7670F4|nr:lytic transglycosylase domain-containing protein [Clostridiales bacterium]MDY2729284.1 lytic transglycosylase domain-containing protein [Clostridium sp.]